MRIRVHVGIGVFFTRPKLVTLSMSQSLLLICLGLLFSLCSAVDFPWNVSCTACGPGGSYALSNGTTFQNPNIFCALGDTLMFTLDSTLSGHPWTIVNLAGSAYSGSLSPSSPNPVSSFPASNNLTYV